MKFLRTRLIHIAIALVMALSLVLGLSSFSTPHASASGGDLCVYAPYAAPLLHNVYPQGQALRVFWQTCATHDEVGPFTFQIWVAPTNELFSMMAGPSQSIGLNGYTFDYPKPLIPEPSYTFWVMQCFPDGTCTGWSNAMSGSFPSSLWWL